MVTAVCFRSLHNHIHNSAKTRALNKVASRLGQPQMCGVRYWAYFRYIKRDVQTGGASTCGVGRGLGVGVSPEYTTNYSTVARVVLAHYAAGCSCYTPVVVHTKHASCTRVPSVPRSAACGERHVSRPSLRELIL